MNESINGPTATHEIIQRINVLKARISGFDREDIESAEHRLEAARSVLAADERLLAEWLDIANRSA